MRGRKILLITIFIVLILAIGIIGAIFLLGTDLFKGNDEKFLTYLSQNSKIIEIIENGNILEQNNLKQANTHVFNGDLLMEIKQTDGSLENINLATAGIYNNTTKRTYTEAVLKNGESNLLKFSYINNEDIYAIRCADILNNYIGIKNSNLKEFATKLGMDEETAKQIPDRIDFNELVNQYAITEQEKEHIIKTYLGVVKENISEEKYSKLDKTTITVFNENYECNAYALTLDGQTIKQIIINCLNTAKNDDVILSIFNKFNTDDSIKLQDEIAKLIEELQAETIEYTITITVYENNEKLLKTEIKLSNEAKIIIDLNQNNQKAIIAFEIYNTQETGEETIQTETTNNMRLQINLEKKTEGNNITNLIEIIPDTTDTVKFNITKTIGKLDGNIIKSSSTTAITESSGKVVSSTYTKTIQITEQVPEIPELKNSNTIIFNNYTAEQLTPFLTNLSTKAENVISSKLQQLPILNNESENNNSATDIMVDTTDTITELLEGIIASGISIANTNGIEVEKIVPEVAVVGVGLGLYIYTGTSESITHSQEAVQEMEEELEYEEQLQANTQAYLNQLLETP